MTCLVGRNGAGKTTVLRAIMGLPTPQAGSIVLSGREASGMRLYERTRFGIGYCPEERAIFSSLTVDETLRFSAVCAAAKADIFALFPIFAPGDATTATSSAAASSRCSPSPGFYAPARRRFFWMNPPRTGAGHRPADRACADRTQASRLHDPAGGTEPRPSCISPIVVAIENGAVVDDLETCGGEHVKARLLERLAPDSA